MRRLLRIACYAFYYGFACWLPPSDAPLGGVWRRIRGFCARGLLGSCGKAVNIDRGAYFHSGARIRLGDYSGIGRQARLHGTISIGKHVMIGPDVNAYTHNHRTDRTDIPMRLQGFEGPRPITIEDDVWIGGQVILLPGVRIGRGAIVGAGAVVTHDVPPYAVAVGNPAHTVKFRDRASNRQDRLLNAVASQNAANPGSEKPFSFR